MKKYKVLETCTTYKQYGFKKKLWEKDSIIELQDNDLPIIHFQLIKSSKEEIKKEIDLSDTFSSMQQKQKDAATPKTGFASTLNKIEPEINKSHKPKK